MQRLAASAAIRGYVRRSLTVPSLRFCCSATQQWNNKKESKSKDVVDLILHDHHQIEAHFRALRDRTSDRNAVLHSFAELLIAHSDAEEASVYPRLRQAAEAAGEKKKEKQPNAEAEHTEALVHLLALMETSTDSEDAWEKKFHSLVAGVAQHIEVEETTLLNVARQDLSAQQREEIGAAFARLRSQKMGSGCGSIEHVRTLVDERATMMQKIREKVAAAVQ